MSDTEARDAHLYKYPPFAQLKALVSLAVIGVALALVLALWSGSVQRAESPDIALLGALGLLQDAALMVGALATVGAIVLGGVRALHTSPELSEKSRP